MKNKKDRVIFMSDCQSFYASVEKVAHPEYRNKPLAVCGDPARRSGIVLAACPIAKNYGVTTAERIGDAIKKCPQLIVVQPRMQEYINVSLLITSIYQSFSELVLPYSCDEQMIDVTGSTRLFGTPLEIAKAMQDAVMQQTGIYIRIGISSNKILAKMACDTFAKKNATGIFTLNKDDLPTVLWPFPIDKLFMVGSRMTQHFMSMGIYTVGDLARIPLADFKRMLRSKMGKQSDIQAELFWSMANGHDDSPVTPGVLFEKQKMIGHGMTLPRDYRTKEDILVVLLEMTELVCQRCRANGDMGWVVTCGAMGADYDHPSGFFRQMRMADPSNITDEVNETVEVLFKEHWDKLPVRKVSVALGDFVSDREYQIRLFSKHEKKKELEKATDKLKQKYGDSIILRAVSLTDAGQARDRSKKIGGHFR